MEWDCSKLWLAPDCEQLKGKRDRALLAVLLACGLRRHEAVDLESGHIQQRDEHWALEQIQFLLGHVSIQTTERYLGCRPRIRSAVNDQIGIEPTN